MRYGKVGRLFTIRYAIAIQPIPRNGTCFIICDGSTAWRYRPSLFVLTLFLHDEENHEPGAFFVLQPSLC